VNRKVISNVAQLRQTLEGIKSGQPAAGPPHYKVA
jgi:hypothetical protein